MRRRHSIAKSVGPSPHTLVAVEPYASAAAHLLTPLGRALILASDAAVIGMFIGEETVTAALDKPITDLTRTAARQIAEYFAHKRQDFTLPVEPLGSSFEQAVWSMARSVPYGRTTAYTEIASRVGTLKDLANVVTALERNPCRVLVPCHRVLAESGSLGVFALGPSAKRFLLELEQSPAV